MVQNHFEKKSIQMESIPFEKNCRCNECGGFIISNGFEKTCKECGIVHSDFKFGESIFFVANSRNNQTVQNYSLGKQITYASEQGSDIGHSDSSVLNDIRNNPLSPETQKKFKRLIRYYNKPAKTKFNETEARILTILNRVSGYLQLKKNVIENAAFYYKKILKNEVRVINNVCVLALSIFMCTRVEGNYNSISILEIAQVFTQLGHHVTPRLILRARVRYGKYFNIEIVPNNPNRYFPRFIENLLVNKEFLARFNRDSYEDLNRYRLQLNLAVIHIMKFLPPKLYLGRNPVILASALIYAADRIIAKNRGSMVILTQKIVADSTNVAEYSLRDHYVKIVKPVLLKEKLL